MLDYDDAFRDVYIVFLNTTYAGSNFFKDGFKHVYIIERQGLGWICIDPSRSDLHATILPASFKTDIMTTFVQQNKDTTILHAKIKPHDDTLHPSFGILSCVSMIQYCLGVYWPFTLTPYMLYKKLTKGNLPPHLEVTTWHDTKYTKPKGKQLQQHQLQSKRVKSSSANEHKIKSELREKEKKHNV